MEVKKNEFIETNNYVESTLLAVFYCRSLINDSVHFAGTENIFAVGRYYEVMRVLNSIFSTFSPALPQLASGLASHFLFRFKFYLVNV